MRCVLISCQGKFSKVFRFCPSLSIDLCWYGGEYGGCGLWANINNLFYHLVWVSKTESCGLFYDKHSDWRWGGTALIWFILQLKVINYSPQYSLLHYPLNKNILNLSSENISFRGQKWHFKSHTRLGPFWSGAWTISAPNTWVVKLVEWSLVWNGLFNESKMPVFLWV